MNGAQGIFDAWRNYKTANAPSGTMCPAAHEDLRTHLLATENSLPMSGTGWGTRHLRCLAELQNSECPIQYPEDLRTHLLAAENSLPMPGTGWGMSGTANKNGETR